MTHNTTGILSAFAATRSCCVLCPSIVVIAVLVKQHRVYNSPRDLNLKGIMGTVWTLVVNIMLPPPLVLVTLLLLPLPT